MAETKYTSYSIHDAFKSLDMLEEEYIDNTFGDEEFEFIRAPKDDSQHLEETFDSSSVGEETLSEEQMRAIDEEIEKNTQQLYQLRERFENDSTSLSESEFVRLKEAGLLTEEEEDKLPKKVNLKDTEEVEDVLSKLDSEKVEDNVEVVVDVEAETEEDLRDNYIGSYILQCSVCRTLIYKDEEDVVHSEDEEELVNLEDECPHCRSTEGFYLVGMVAPIDDSEQEDESDSELEKIPNDEEETSDNEETDKSEEDDEYDDFENEIDFEEDEEDLEEEVNIYNRRKKEIVETLDDVNIEEFDETLFNRLASKYLNSIYENVENFKINSGSIEDETNKITLEGVVNFKSGKTMPSSFVFTPTTVTKRGKLRFEGINKSLVNAKKPFVLLGTIEDSKFLSESLSYNYSLRVNEELKRVYGRVTEDIERYKKENY